MQIIRCLLARTKGICTWGENVLRNAAVTHEQSRHCETRLHTLKIWMVDPGIVLDTVAAGNASTEKLDYLWLEKRPALLISGLFRLGCDQHHAVAAPRANRHHIFQSRWNIALAPPYPNPTPRRPVAPQRETVIIARRNRHHMLSPGGTSHGTQPVCAPCHDGAILFQRQTMKSSRRNRHHMIEPHRHVALAVIIANPNATDGAVLFQLPGCDTCRPRSPSRY